MLSKTFAAFNVVGEVVTGTFKKVLIVVFITAVTASILTTSLVYLGLQAIQ